MNIRSLSNPAQVLAKDKIESSKGIKSDETADREANGQQPQGDQTDDFRPLTDEEAEQVLEKVRANDGIQKSGLIVSLSFENDQRIMKIETPEGQTVKRFIERDLFQFFKDNSSSDDFQLVKKLA